MPPTSKKPPIDQVEHHYAATIVVTESGRIIAQHRDDIPGIDNRDMIGMFGGTVELGEEPHTAAWRELVQEETNLSLKLEDLTLFWEGIEWRAFANEWEVYHIYQATISDQDLENLEVYEGQGWVEITDPHSDKIIAIVRPIFERFIKSQQ